MNMNHVFILLFATFVASSLADRKYTASVFDYNPNIESEPKKTVEENLKVYKIKIQEAKDKGSNIIVFPEYGLTGIVTDPRPYAIFTNESYPYTNETLRQMSDAAQEHGMYVVVNLLEKEYVNHTTFFYNTNLVFDNNGKITAKYRKINLYDENQLTAGHKAVTFQAFNLKFGLMTGSDILNFHPARTIINDGATEILFPAAWRSTLPFFSGLSVQQGYVEANGVNLLTANYDKIDYAMGGSSINSYDLKVHYSRIFTYTSSLLLTNAVEGADPNYRKCVNKPSLEGYDSDTTYFLNDDNWNDMSKYKTHKVFQSKNYNFKSIDMKSRDKQQNITVTHGKVTCEFRIELFLPDVNREEVFKVMAFDGFEETGYGKKHLQICSLLVCKSSDNTCGDRVKTTSAFSRIYITAQLPTTKVTFFQPSSLTLNLEPLTNERFCTNPSDNTTTVVYEWAGRQNGIITFGFVALGGAAHTAASFGFILTTLFVLVHKFVV